MRIRCVAVWIAVSVVLGIATCCANAADDAIDFIRDVRPILSANCFACHGPDEKAREAGLRLDSFEAATATRDGNRAIVPGKPEASDLVERINSQDPDLVMPPPKTGHTLTAAQRAVLIRWIQAGAQYDQHWSFKPLVRPTVPEVAAHASRIRNPMDAFVWERLSKARLVPEAEAEVTTLLRRVSLDLIGLPPTIDELDRFLKDCKAESADRSVDATNSGAPITAQKAVDVAYERAVDRLLGSQRFGEHWARLWLDLARYADTKGYEKDQPRQIWRYRDWVIDAFNADMPFDQFTIEQLAGDLLPGATESQVLATAFHRNTMTNDEGGTDDEEFRVAAVKDRINTTIQVWMGLTMGCANCHSHKYDPITQQDYYRFYAIFNQTEDHDRFDDSPTVPTPTAEQKQQLAAVDTKLKQLNEEFWAPLPEIADRQAEWEQQLAGQNVWTPLHPESAQSEQDATLSRQADGSVLVSGKHPEYDTYTLVAPVPLKRVTAIRLDALTHESLPKNGPGRHKDDHNFVVSELSLANAAAPDARITFKNARADFSQQGWDVAKAIDGNEATGWAVSPQQGKPHVAIFELAELWQADAGKFAITLVQKYSWLQLGHFRLSVTDVTPGSLKPEIQTINELAAITREQRTRAQQRQLDESFRRQYEPTAKIAMQITAAEQEREAIQKQVPKTPIFRELPSGKRRVTRIHQRGNFLEPGDEVQAALLSVFALPAAEPAPNRLAAARWLVSAENPLTARVAVNRFWARLFGVGLVETEEDFGAQGTPPTHPELLDWLAAEFRDTHQWSVKKLLKTIVMSATYRQSSHVSPEKLAADPRNLLLSRAPRFRLSAEVIRDQALTVSGLLSPKLHGPSVMPPQPAGLWKAAYSSLKWETSPGQDRYRRALYTFLRRTSPYPSMTTFDAGSGEVCTIRRVRTNTPLQALVTLNDPAFFEAAGALGRRVLTNAGAAADDRLDYAFRLVLSRRPTEAETARLVELLGIASTELQNDPATARSLIESAHLQPEATESVAELAAWTLVGNVLLNLDETVSKY